MNDRTKRAALIAGVTALAVGGYGAADVYDLVPGVLTRDVRALPPESTPQPSTGAHLVAPAAVPPLAPLSAAAPIPTGRGLGAALATPLRAPILGPSVSIDVRDGLTGERLYGVRQAVPHTPASTAKVLTAAAVTHAGDGRRPYTTRVVRGASPSEIVLVAGGDTLLAPDKGDSRAVAGHAGVGDLARDTARALKAAKVGTVTVRLDDSYARGPALAPRWEPVDVANGLTGPVTMLATTTMRAVPGRAAPADPPLATTQAFAAALTRAGIRVEGTVTRGAAPTSAHTLAHVDSAPRAEVLELALAESDNALTETAARVAAAEAGVRDLSFASVARWVVAQLDAQGVTTTGVHLEDSCGLSRTDRVPAVALTDVLALGASGASPSLTDVVSRLPVAGLTGTLTDRFGGRGSSAGLGVARAKTGTLTGVNALAGTVADADGRLLVFSVLADRTGGTLEARAALDDVVAALARCGCR